MHTSTQASTPPEIINIVFDRTPPSSKGKYALSLGVPYRATLVNAETRLYSTQDDKGVAFNVATYGQGYSNGGNWHIEPFAG